MDIITIQSLITQDLSFLHEQIAFHEKRAASLKDTEWRAKIHLETADKFRSVISHITDLLSQYQQQKAPKSPASAQLSLKLEDIEDLPEDLIKQLSISDSDRVEFAITSLIEEAGGILSLDKILIGLYKRTGEIHKRSITNNRILRMIQRKELFSVPSKKGAYSTRELSPDEVDKIINSKPFDKNEG